MNTTSTQGHYIDLIALRAWHWKASMDTDRTKEMRVWHRDQTEHITRRMQAKGLGPSEPVKVALIELMASKHRAELFRHAGNLAPFTWEKFCKAALDEIKKDSLSVPYPDAGPSGG